MQETRHAENSNWPRLLPITVLILAAILAGQTPAHAWEKELTTMTTPDHWTQRADWCGANVSTQATLEASQEGVIFRVPEAGKSMKWMGTVPDGLLGQTPWLKIRCRGAKLPKDATLMLWIDAGSPGTELLYYNQVPTDGYWRTLAVDMTALTGAATFGNLLVHLQAAGENAWLEISSISLCSSKPASAIILNERTYAEQAMDMPSAASTAWTAPGASGLPAGSAGCEAQDGVVTCRLDLGRSDLVWLRQNMTEQPDPTQYRALQFEVRTPQPCPIGWYRIYALGYAREGGDYKTILLDRIPIRCENTGWRTLEVPLNAAWELQQINGLGIGLETAGQPVTLQTRQWAVSPTFQSHALSDTMTAQSGWSETTPSDDEPLDLSAVNQMSASDAADWFGLQAWPQDERVTLEGLPFQLTGSDPVAAVTAMDKENTLTLTLQGNASEIYLLTAAGLFGLEDHIYTNSYVYAPGWLRIADQIDLLAMEIHYTDGSQMRARPKRIAGGQAGVVPGFNLLAIPADPGRTLESLTIYTGSAKLRLAVAAVTLNRTATPRFASLWEPEAMPQALEIQTQPAEKPPVATLAGQTLTLENSSLRARFDLAAGGSLTALRDNVAGLDYAFEPSAQPLFGVRLGSPTVDEQAMTLQTAILTEDQRGAAAVYQSANGQIEMTLTLSIDERARITTACRLRNLSATTQQVFAIGSRLTPFSIGPAEQMWYLLPASETVLNHEPTNYRALYCGTQMSMQFIDVSNPTLGSGLCWLVRDQADHEKEYIFSKTAQSTTMWLDYIQQPLEPQATLELAPTDLCLHTGDWQRGLQIYQDWLKTWYSPRAPRPQWWRETFHLRQVFLHIIYPAVNWSDKSYHITDDIALAEREFGGVDYVHIFDWGMAGPYGRTYGRVGDYDPGETYDTGYYLPGGWDAFKAEVQKLREGGKRMGYYIEGYLVNTTGKLGQYKEAWSMADSAGNLIHWPDSPEYGYCPHIEAWQEIQAQSFAQMVTRMDADGMYIDQFGTAGNSWRRCWSSEHGHPVPSNGIVEENRCMERIRQAMTQAKPDTVLYSEYIPTDTGSQFQEGAFSYALQRQQGEWSLAPLRLFRFAFPDFKSFSLLRCDTPTGPWATGVRWSLWNGDALWLQGSPTEWFAPQTRREIRRCYAVLHRYRSIFAGDDVQPLVPTLASGVYANRFSNGVKSLYTLYNDRDVTFSGELLSLKAGKHHVYVDGFTQQPLPVRQDGGRHVITMTIHPKDVACVVTETSSTSSTVWLSCE